MDSDERKRWLERIKAAVLAVEPTATVLLYGSRARGDARPDSDWDFLILLDGEVNYKREQHLRHRLYPIEWETGEVISMVIRSRQAWLSSHAPWSPFRENVRREAITI